jgi:hypothetical protein
MEPLGIVLRNLVVQSPILLVWLAGFGLAVLRWQRHPRVSLLTVIAIVLYFVGASGNAVAGRWLAVALRNLGWVVSGTLGSAIISFVMAVIKAVAWALLFAAVFGWRREQN